MGREIHFAVRLFERKKVSQMDFYKAKIFSIRLSKRPSGWMYVRLANASELWFLWFCFSWRRSWLPQAAYQKGWDAAWRQFYLIDGESREKVMQEIRNEQSRVVELRRVS